MKTEKQVRILFIQLLVLLIALSIAALCIGRYVIPLEMLYYAILSPEQVTDPAVTTVLWQVRLPRIIMAILAGAGLAVTGASLQAMFANPLVSDHILGVASGAGFGAAFGIVFLTGTLGIIVSSTAFGFVAMILACLVATKHGQIKPLMLVLSGVIINSLFTAGISILQYVADPEKQLPSIVFWLMGSLAKSTTQSVLSVAPIMIVCIFILYKIRWQLNLISLNEEESISLGINVKRIRYTTIICSTLVSATIVSTCGMISFVSLIIPHFGRMILGTDNKQLIPVLILLGAIFFIIVDTLARTLTATEIPLSILTSFIGAPFFAYLLHKTGGVWND